MKKGVRRRWVGEGVDVVIVFFGVVGMSGETEGRKNSAEGFPTAARDPPNCDTAEFDDPK